MPSESQQIMEIYHNMVDAKEEEKKLRSEVEAANSEGLEVAVPYDTFQEMQERR